MVVVLITNMSGYYVWDTVRCAVLYMDKLSTRIGPETDLRVHLDHEILSRADKVYIYWCSHLLTTVS